MTSYTERQFQEAMQRQADHERNRRVWFAFGCLCTGFLFGLAIGALSKGSL